MSDMDECEWFNDAEGPFCWNGVVVEFDFFQNNLRGLPIKFIFNSSAPTFLAQLSCTWMLINGQGRFQQKLHN
jgi:hypothetical protein